MNDEQTVCDGCGLVVDPSAPEVVRALPRRETDEFGVVPDEIPALFHKTHLPRGWRVVPKER